MTYAESLEGTGPWPARRFSQAISEGDGISLIPILSGGDVVLAEAAEAAGAEALAVESVEDVRRLRASTELPLLVRMVVRDEGALREARQAGADACILVLEELGDEGDLLEELHAAALDLGLDCALDVRDEGELERALERIDPEIVILSGRELDKDETELERTLDLLPDVPAGKLVVSETRIQSREQVLELERAGVDAVVVGGLAGGMDFRARLEELVGRR